MNAVLQQVRQALARLSPREQRLVAVFGGLLVLASAWSFVLSPLLGGREGMRREIDSLAGELTELESLASRLYTAGLPDPDLLIRTSGELRVSNFLLWQIAYAEIYVTETFWPDFKRRDLLNAILDYQKRERRFGGLGAVDSQPLDEAVPIR